MKKWIGLILFVLLILIVAVAAFQIGSTREPEPGWVAVRRGSIEKKAMATGILSPEFEVEVKSQVSGIVSRIFRRMGEKVKKGDPLVEIQPNPTPFESVSAKRSLEAARLNEERALEIKERKNLYASFMAFFMGSKEVERQYEQAKLGTKRAEESLSLLKEGKVILDEERIDSVVRSPIDGFILERAVNQGDPISPMVSIQGGTVLMRVADMENLVFRGTVDEIDVGKLREGMKAAISVGALPDAAITGTLQEISLKARQRGNASVFDVRISLSGTEGYVLRAGYSATARILIEQKENVLLLPERVIEFRNGESFVRIISKEKSGEPEERKIETGLSNGLEAEVLSGLKEGERVLEKTFKEIE